MILNKDYFPYLGANKTEWKTDTIYFNIRDWNDYDYWFCEFFNSESIINFNFELFITSEILHLIRHDEKTFLVLCNAHEAFHDIVETIYLELIIKKNIPPQKIILLSESYDIDFEVKRISSKYNLDVINVEWTLIFEHGIQQYAYKNWYRLTSELGISQKTKFEKLFINLNRRWRPHRPMTVAMLFCRNLLDRGYVSLMKDVEGRNWENVYDWLRYIHRDNEELSLILDLRKSDIFNIPDLFVDAHDLNNNKAAQSKEIDAFYKNSFLSIVSETNFYTSHGFNNSRFLSEKTFKPIMFQHPFFMFSVPQSLDVLKFLGYQTFEPFIDESYDEEHNDSIRMIKIINEIEKLSLMSHDNLLDLSKSMIPVLEFNFFHLLDRKKYCYKKL